MNREENLIIVLAGVVLLITIATATVTFLSIANFKQTWITGYATSTATTNITVVSTAAINFTTNNINWTNGSVVLGATNATLNTAYGTVVGGTWVPVTQGFVLENIGNVNVSLSLKTNKNATQFLGGTGPHYKFNVTNIEATSCLNYSYHNFTLQQFVHVNATSYNAGLNNFSRSNDGILVCSLLKNALTTNSIRIDLELTVPADSFTGNLSDIMTATATQV
jgi:hypothetical protein